MEAQQDTMANDKESLRILIMRYNDMYDNNIIFFTTCIIILVDTI